MSSTVIARRRASRWRKRWAAGAACRRHVVGYLAVALGLLVLVPAARAQSTTVLGQYVQVYARPGHPTIDVFVWGSVGVPGIWRVEPEVDLVELLSVVRVPGVGVDEAGIHQQTRLQIFREQGGRRVEIYNEEVEYLLSEARTYPVLQEGDILEVVTQRRTKVNVLTVSQIVGTLSSLVVLVLSLAE